MPLSISLLLADRDEHMSFKVNARYLLRIRHVFMYSVIKTGRRRRSARSYIHLVRSCHKDWIWQVTSSHELILSSFSPPIQKRMRFTPTDRPKKPLVEDSAKKIHVKFDNDDEVPKVEIKKRSSNSDQAIDHQHKKQRTNKGNNTSNTGGRKAVQITAPGTSSPKPKTNNKRAPGKGMEGIMIFLPSKFIYSILLSGTPKKKTMSLEDVRAIREKKRLRRRAQKQIGDVKVS